MEAVSGQGSLGAYERGAERSLEEDRKADSEVTGPVLRGGSNVDTVSAGA